MTRNIFIAGSISIKHLPVQVAERIDNIIANPDLHILVGDAPGVDTEVQAYLRDKHMNRVTVYYAGLRCRNNLGDWPSHTTVNTNPPGTRAYFTVKDLAMANAAHCGLMIWDSRSLGTFNNITELVKRRKKSVVWLDRKQRFMTVATAIDLALLR